MVNDLAALGIAINYRAESSLIYLFASGNFLRGEEHRHHLIGVIRENIQEGGNMELWYYQHMDGGQGMDIVKGQDQIILVNPPAGNFPPYNLAKNAIFHAYPPRERLKAKGYKKPYLPSVYSSFSLSTFSLLYQSYRLGQIHCSGIESLSRNYTNNSFMFKLQQTFYISQTGYTARGDDGD